jgi:chemotaxis protein CheD
MIDAATASTASIVGVAEAAVRRGPGSIVTYALGSCVAVVLVDRARAVAGVLHLMLPESRTNPERAAERPATFADTGVPALLRAVVAAGADRRAIVAALAGGAELLADLDRFRIGARNVAAARSALEAAGIPLVAEDVGGSRSRTLAVALPDVRITVRSSGQESPLWSPTT